MDAVRAHGPGVSVADIAAQAGITKPVLYRHFDDRADLHRAVGLQAASLLMARIAPELEQEREPVEHIRAVIDAFLGGVEDEPELWRFVVHNPGERTWGAEVVDDVRQTIASQLATLLGERLRAMHVDSGGVEAWGLGIVGMVQSAGDWWLERRTMSRAALTDHLTTLVWGGMAAVLGGQGPAAAAPLRLLHRDGLHRDHQENDHLESDHLQGDPSRRDTGTGTGTG